MILCSFINKFNIYNFVFIVLATSQEHHYIILQINYLLSYLKAVLMHYNSLFERI
jgi:hypothetical protein